jgi:hypothetical protein
MAKNTELLNSYTNQNKAAMIQKIESAEAAQGGYYTVFYGQEGNLEDREKPGYVDVLKAEVASKFPDAQILATVAPDGRRAVVCHTGQNLKEVVDSYQQITGEKMQRDERVIPFHERYELTKWRGHLGNIGQFFMLLSGLGLNTWVQKNIFKMEGIEGKPNPYKSTEKVVSTIASTIGNGLNSIFGVQKKPDDARLAIIKRKSTSYVHKYSAEPLELPDNKDRLTPYNWHEKPETSEEKVKVLFEQNAGVLSEVLKIVGKYSFFVGGKKKDNDGNKAHGSISMAAKFVTLIGKDEDPYGIEGSTDWLTKLRQKSNLISGGMEWLANISLFMGAIMKKVPLNLGLRDVYEVTDGKLTDQFIWNDKQQARFAASFGKDKNGTLKTSFNDLIGSFIERVEDSVDPVTNEKKTGYFVYKETIVNDYHNAKAGDKVRGFDFVPNKADTLKGRREKSPEWQMFDWKNNFLMKPKDWDWFQLLGATAIVFSLSTKMMAPFTEKKINTDELFAHNAVGIAALPDYQKSQTLAGLTQRVFEMKAPSGIDMVPEVKKMGFAAAYAGIANTLYQRHQYDLVAQAPRGVTPVKQAEPAVEATIAPAVEEKTTSATLAEQAVASTAKEGGSMVTDLRDRIQEARERGAGAFAEKYGATEGMSLGTASAV